MPIKSLKDLNKIKKSFQAQESKYQYVMLQDVSPPIAVRSRKHSSRRWNMRK
jgi:hypothetical protein